MKSFTVMCGLAAPMDRDNVDTDLIIPKQFLKSIKRSGFGPNLFDELRYLDEGEPGQDCSQRPLNPDFPLNHERYHGASILLARENFGCGSSREHAPWALEDYGFRCIIAPSFADIFYSNCFKNGVLPIKLDENIIEKLIQESTELEVDLENQTLKTTTEEIMFDIDSHKKKILLEGLDDIAQTLKFEDKITDFEKQSKIPSVL